MKLTRHPRRVRSSSEAPFCLPRVPLERVDFRYSSVYRLRVQTQHVTLVITHIFGMPGEHLSAPTGP